MTLNPHQIYRLLQLTAGEFGRELYWYVTGPDNELHFSIDCSDFFELACADAEPVETEEDLHLLEQLKAKLGPKWDDWGAELYAATRRKRAVRGAWLDPDSPRYIGDEIAGWFREAAQ